MTRITGRVGWLKGRFLKSGEQYIQETSMCLGSADMVLPEYHRWDKTRVGSVCRTRMRLSVKSGPSCWRREWEVKESYDGTTPKAPSLMEENQKTNGINLPFQRLPGKTLHLKSEENEVLQG